MDWDGVDQDFIFKQFDPGEAIWGDKNGRVRELGGVSIDEFSNLKLLSLGSYLWVRIQLAVGLCLELDSIELEVGKHAVDIVKVRGLSKWHECEGSYWFH